MDLKDRIAAHAALDEFRTIDVPEWGENGVPLVIKYKPVTLGDLTDAYKLHPNDAVRQNVDILCMKAMDEDGKPLFKRIDALHLMEKAAPDVLLRITRAMMGGLASDQAEKN